MKKKHNLQLIRKDVKTKIKTEITSQERNKVEASLENLEKAKDDSNKYYRVIREINKSKPKPTLVVKNKENSYVSNEIDQAEEIKKHFKNALAPLENPPENKTYPPCRINNPFTAREIRKNVNRMKNRKSPGPDNVNVELIKYAPESVHQEIADIYNQITESNNFPDELKLGILTPIPKPGKPKGPPENLRPIILLSVIRKILTICLLNRCWDRFAKFLPKDQAAYQPGRSTTEQVFACKVLAEKAISCSNFKLYLLLLDMSKAFDTVDRNKLFQILETLLLPDELHLFDILTNDCKLQVRVGTTLSDAFTTQLGIMQGDCLSAILFIIYLAYALNHRQDQTENEHLYATPRSLAPAPIPTDHTYALDPSLAPLHTNKSVTTVTPKYADDITYISTDKQYINNITESVPKQLKHFNLQINLSKTEEYQIPDDPTTPAKQSWKKCKLLGTLLDSVENIKRRKALALDTITAHKHIYKSKKLSIATKIRHFNTFIEPIVLYHAEIWTVTATAEKAIDSFQRRLLRIAIDHSYPKKLSTEKLNKLVKFIPWSQTIKKRRLSWLGHLLRLHPDTPARKALVATLNPDHKRKVGHPPTTWTTIVNRDLKEIDKNFSLDSINSISLLENICADRDKYRKMINTVCPFEGGTKSDD